MYKLNCILTSAVSNACRQLVSSVNATGNFLCGSSGLQRSLYTSAVRLRETAESTTADRDFSIFPPVPGDDSPLRWEGKKYEELHIIYLKCTYNNTHVQVTESDGHCLVRTSCGTEGFKNAKKATPVAAQAAAMSASAKAQDKGVKFVRLVVRGIGPGRMPAIKGLTMGGLTVVSVTDNTPVPHNGCRPRKARRN